MIGSRIGFFGFLMVLAIVGGKWGGKQLGSNMGVNPRKHVKTSDVDTCSRRKSVGTYEKQRCLHFMHFSMQPQQHFWARCAQRGGTGLEHSSFFFIFQCFSYGLEHRSLVLLFFC